MFLHSEVPLGSHPLLVALLRMHGNEKTDNSMFHGIIACPLS